MTECLTLCRWPGSFKGWLGMAWHCSTNKQDADDLIAAERKAFREVGKCQRVVF